MSGEPPRFHHSTPLDLHRHPDAASVRRMANPRRGSSSGPPRVRCASSRGCEEGDLTAENEREARKGVGGPRPEECGLGERNTIAFPARPRSIIAPSFSERRRASTRRASLPEIIPFIYTNPARQASADCMLSCPLSGTVSLELSGTLKAYRLSGGPAPSQEFPACGQLRDFELRDELSRRSWPGFERTHGRARHVLPNGRFERRSRMDSSPGGTFLRSIGAARIPRTCRKQSR
jgi:hypothetical protein